MAPRHRPRRPDKCPRYRRALRALRAECPTSFPVRVRLLEAAPRTHRAMSNLNRARTGFNVTLYRRAHGRRVPDIELADSLCHEWAHCLAWREHRPGLDDHGPEWGVYYAECYRAVFAD